LLLQRVLVPPAHAHPAVLDLPPQLFDTVELRTVGGQEVQRQAVALEVLEVGPNGLGVVHAGVVQDDR